MRTKSTPPIKDLISSKRGIIFSLNLFNSFGRHVDLMDSNGKLDNGTGEGLNGTGTGLNGTGEGLNGTGERDLDDNEDEDDDESASSSQSKGQAKRNRTQTGDSLLLLSDDMMDVEMMDEDEDDAALIHSATLATTAQQQEQHQDQHQHQTLNPNNNNSNNNALLSSSPLSSVGGGGSKQGSSILDDYEEHDIATDLTTTSTTTSTSTSSPKNGYDLSVAVHKVTSTALHYRMHKQKQEGKYKNSPVQINPTIWSKASLASYTNGGLASSLFPSSNPAANKLHTGDGPAYRKRKINQSASQAGECNWCGTRKTAQWRKGPTGARGLCNVRCCFCISFNHPY